MHSTMPLPTGSVSSNEIHYHGFPRRSDLNLYSLRLFTLINESYISSQVRNEADSATNDFHAYLVGQLLTTATKILAALEQQDKSVKQLSDKMDKNFAGLAEKMQNFLTDQNQLRQEKVQADSEFFAGLEGRNSALTRTFEGNLTLE